MLKNIKKTMTNFVQIFIPILILFIYFIYNNQSSTEVILVRSDIDGRKYLVQNKPDKQEAANRLAQIRNTLIKFVNKLYQEESQDERAKRLKAKFDPDKISEGTEDARYTTYTLNKGEKVVFCLRTRDRSDHVHKLNMMIFVAVHELGHICTLSEGHTPEFNTNFEWLIEKAVNYGIYTPQNFREQPEQYCGIPVTDTPLKESFFK